MAPLFPASDAFKAALAARHVAAKPYDGPPFPFLQLPREIRDVIYEYALVMPRNTPQDPDLWCDGKKQNNAFEPALGNTVPIRLTLIADFRGLSEWTTITTDDSDEDNSARRPPPRLSTHPPCFHRPNHIPLATGLLTASRQLAAEALPVVYSLNAFAGCPRTIHHFLSTISPRAVPLIRTLHVWGLEPPSPPLHLNPTMAFYPRFNYHNLPAPPDDGGLPKRRCGTTWNAGYRSSSGDEPRVFELSPAATGVRELGLVFCEERLVGGRRAAREEDGSAYAVDAREAAEVVCGYAGGWMEAWVRREVEEGKREEAVVDECVGRVVRVVAGPDGYRSSEIDEGVFRRELGALVRGRLAEGRSR
ncbi:hypothetical protein DIS24_g10151 [Lasiodiplodia hormozganensis]|uniref:Uncharacterized protein n=1 Tax=Lasiodiplodia hormozganensis TaxID=869390 RepID=A0AA40CH53_9PEZI|nr:hypothetical protein DIS24_g10151 [Lasiodiplodia hormozganensis]